VLIAHNKDNSLTFYEYLLGLQEEPVSNFLQMLSSVIDTEENPKHKLRIFLGICGLYKRGMLTVAPDLYDPMFDYLANVKAVTQKQALGFLRLIFNNNVGLTKCPLKNIL